MTPDEIVEAYKVLAQNVNDNAAQEAARVGNAQRSLGALAEKVASPANQTYGLANYTYDRTMRPVVDSTARALATQGLASGLEQALTDALRAAKNRYEDARNSSYAKSAGGNNNTTKPNDPYKEITDNSYTGENIPQKEYTQYLFEDYYQKWKNGEITDQEWDNIRSGIWGGNAGEAQQRQELYLEFWQKWQNGEITDDEWERIKIGL